MPPPVRQARPVHTGPTPSTSVVVTSRGDGQGLARSIAAAVGDIVVLVDPHHPDPAADIRLLVAALTAGADVARTAPAGISDNRPGAPGCVALWRDVLPALDLPSHGVRRHRRSHGQWDDGVDIEPLITVRAIGHGFRVDELVGAAPDDTPTLRLPRIPRPRLPSRLTGPDIPPTAPVPADVTPDDARPGGTARNGWAARIDLPRRGRHRRHRTVRTGLVVGALAVVAIGSAVALPAVTSPPAPTSTSLTAAATADGVTIDVRSAETGFFTVRVGNGAGFSRHVGVALTRGGRWSWAVDVPPGTPATVELYRAGTDTPVRTVTTG